MCVDVHVCSVVPGYATLMLLFPHLAVKWGPGINWGSSPPSCNTNGNLVITGKANAQLSISLVDRFYRYSVSGRMIVITAIPPKYVL